MRRTITLLGARGGQGTSTAAAAIATALARSLPVSLLSHDPMAMATLLGARPTVPDHYAPAEDLLLACLEGPRRDLAVIDGGPAAAASSQAEGPCYAVVRGPSYLALATLVSLSNLRLDEVILFAESGRALSAGDRSAVLGVPVVATVPVSAAISRAADAGLLTSQSTRLEVLRPLREFAARAIEASPAIEPADTHRTPGLTVRRSSQDRTLARDHGIEA